MITVAHLHSFPIKSCGVMPLQELTLDARGTAVQVSPQASAWLSEY